MVATTTPYIIRAIYEWCEDEGLTPHLLVDAGYPEVSVPTGHVVDGAITLNVSANAVRHLELGNEWVMFSARFGGKPVEISVPIPAVRAIYARESGVGVGFPDEASELVGRDTELVPDTMPGASTSSDADDALNARTDRPKGRTHLKLVE